ncbi:superoxide dismutase [Mn], mitochondrial-like, partial [Prunus avium]|uniref:superoxide dismutase n=1 Tax=Prunus avium TaxID=42229 RepID=A0A6P5RMV1_PRUAV
ASNTSHFTLFCLFPFIPKLIHYFKIELFGHPITLILAGHVNHSIFWKNLTPVSHGGGEPPHGSLGWAIDTNFGSMEALVQKINAEGAALQGSGWVWLALDKESKKLVVETTANQDPLVTKGPTLVPLLGIDVWEHAYYLQYKNVRPDYLKNIWKVINWKYAGEVYEKESP